MPTVSTLEFWYAALNSEVGVCLRTNERDKLRAVLYKSRADACDPDLDDLSLVPSPTATDELWIVKKGAKDVSSEG
jgi:hypothetical protein